MLRIFERSIICFCRARSFWTRVLNYVLLSQDAGELYNRRFKCVVCIEYFEKYQEQINHGVISKSFITRALGAMS